MDQTTLLKKLDIPTGVVDVLIDTDAYNEVDDQFAITYALLSPERINTVAICAAPFDNSRCTCPEDGMEQSYNEIIKLLGLMNKMELSGRVYKGSRGFMPDENTYIASEAAE